MAEMRINLWSRGYGEDVKGYFGLAQNGYLRYVRIA